jgi:hypothetical protein
MGTKYKQDKIDKKIFENLCEIQCTEKEICSWFKIDDKTLASWIEATYNGKKFSEVFQQYKDEGKISLRRMQYRLAQSNANLLIWLGKNYLQQKDDQIHIKDEIELTAFADALKKVDTGTA